MAGSDWKRDFSLGLVFFGVIVALIYYTISLTSFSFEEDRLMTIHFPNASGLKSGDTVLVSGKPTGTVSTVEFDNEMPDDRRIKVTIKLDQEIRLHEGHQATITEFTLLGGRAIQIDPGPSDAPLLPPDARILGTVGPSALSALGQLVTENRDDIRQFLKNVRTLSDDLVAGQGVLGGLLYDEDMRADMEQIFADARQLADDIKEGKGTLGMLIEDEEVRQRIVELVNNGASAAVDLRQIAEDLAAGRGTFGALLTDEALRADTVDLIGNLTDVSDSLRRMIAEADQGRGLLGRVIADEALAADAANFVADLAEISRRLREGEGTLGKLMADDEINDQVLLALGLLNAQLEDAREAQPISSFAQLLFGSF